MSTVFTPAEAPGQSRDGRMGYTAAERHRRIIGSGRRFSGRQITVMVVAVCVAVVAAPAGAIAASASFSSSSASTPAVAAKNTSSGTGAKAVFGNASASSGTTYGVYGRTGSADGYGLYSAGRLGSSGALVCSHCVTGGDVDSSGFPTVPSATNATKLGGHATSYYARIVPLSWLGPVDQRFHELASVGGLNVYGFCYDNGLNIVNLVVAADSAAAAGTVNYFSVDGSSAHAHGFPLDTTKISIAGSIDTTQSEGNLIYRNNSTGRIVSIDFHLYGATCELFGDVTTTG